MYRLVHRLIYSGKLKMGGGEHHLDFFQTSSIQNLSLCPLKPLIPFFWLQPDVVFRCSNQSESSFPSWTFWDVCLLTMIVKTSFSGYCRLPDSWNQSRHSPLISLFNKTTASYWTFLCFVHLSVQTPEMVMCEITGDSEKKPVLHQYPIKATDSHFHLI